MSTKQTNLPLARETLFELDGEGSLVAQLERAMREVVRTGRVPAGAALPPSRQLAEVLGVSRWVVTEVYGQLVAEGMFEARAGSVTRVSRQAPIAVAAERSRRLPGQPAGRAPESPRRPTYDLAPGIPDLRHAPRDAWLRSAREALAVVANDDLLVLPWAGHPDARAAVADHLRRARMVAASDDDVILTRGATHGMAMAATALAQAGHRRLLVEDPSWPVLRDVARDAGLDPVPVPVDEGGVDVDALVATAARAGARAALLTPAHQFPTGSALAPERRQRVVAWARDVDGLIIEDDYDAEFRYDRRPVAALQRLDPDRVLLLGSLSKPLAPAFGTGWAVVPPMWRERLESATPDVVAGPSLVDQLTFARMLRSGAFDRHLRATRVRLRRRRDALVSALRHTMGTVDVRGVAAGLHLLLDLGDGAPDAAEVVREAAARDVSVVDLRRYQTRPTEVSRTLVLGYGNLADSLVEEAAARVAAAVRAARSRG